MKELSIEEKAKRYNEAIKVAENIYRFSSDPAEIKRMEQIFPELKESEDEEIRNRLINYFYGFLDGHEDVYKVGGHVKWEGLDVKDAIAWLEKQGEQKPFDYENANIQQKDFAPKSAMEAIREEKIDNQNCVKADKVEPKFHKGRMNDYGNNEKLY